MKTNELLFELSHSVRYEIMKALAQEPLKLTRLGELVGANNPEVSRHLDRLRKSCLVEKDRDGFYYTTPFGNCVMSVLPYLSFITSNPKYFMEHDLSGLPPGFMNRLGELGPCEVVEGTTINILKMERLAKSSKERFLVVSNELITKPTEQDFADLDQALATDYAFRIILSESQLEDKNLMMIADLCGSSRDQHFRVLPQVPMFCNIVDNEVMLAFLDTRGKVDFSVSFCSTDPEVLRWCEDLMNYLWDHSKSISEFRKSTF